MNVTNLTFGKRTLFIFVTFVTSLNLIYWIITYQSPNDMSVQSNTSQGLLFTSMQFSIEYSENIDIGSGVYNAFWVKSKGTFLQRITNFNAAIQKLRKKLMNDRGQSPWKSPGVFKTYPCHKDNFQRGLEKYPAVKTISLSWYHGNTGYVWNSSVDTSNLLLQRYYSWSGSNLLCTNVRTANLMRAHFDARNCKILPNDMSKSAVNLESVYLHGKPTKGWSDDRLHYPDYYYISTPPHVLYLHIMEDAIVTSDGDVITGNVQLVPYTCTHKLSTRPVTDFQKSLVYDEVFIVSQFWGTGFFHLMVEDLPRVAPYLELLKTNPTIMIHVQQKGGFTAQSLEVLGLNRTRLVSGTVRAHRVFLPQGTPCGFPNVHEMQIIAHHYNNYIDSLPNVPIQRRSIIILIRRSGSRQFKQHKNIRKELEIIAKEFHLEFEMFIDNPLPALQKTMLMFHSAALVVGPHGAGLANIVYSKPGTLVIEGVCNPPHINMCYQRTAHVLGMHYHGIVSQHGCEQWVDVGHKQVASAARHLLKVSSRNQ